MLMNNEYPQYAKVENIMYLCGSVMIYPSTIYVEFYWNVNDHYIKCWFFFQVSLHCDIMFQFQKAKLLSTYVFSVTSKVL